MKKITFFFFILVLAAACSKDKFKTQPQITVASYNTKTVGRNGTLSLGLKFTDSEGDLGKGKLVYMIKRTNRRRLLPGVSYLDSIKVMLPEFPNSNEGEIQLQTTWTDLHKDDRENDTIFFRFVAVDRAGNKSDTVNSDQVVVLRQ